MKAKLYTMTFDVINTIERIENNQPVLLTGSLNAAVNSGRLNPVQKYGVTFKCAVIRDDGAKGIVEHGLKFDEKMGLRDTVRAAATKWVEILETEHKDCTVEKCMATINCLARA